MFGFSAEKMIELKNDELLFKSSLLFEIQNYKLIRDKIDNSQDSATKLRSIAEESKAWQRVRSYFDLVDVRIVDVIRVPPFVPHSLQNGVQVVEFQTPTYERLIVAFNQKVLTQSHWDSEKALQLAQFKTGSQLRSELSANNILSDVRGWSVAVNFPEFKVLETELTGSAQLNFPIDTTNFSVLYALSGGVRVTFC